MNMKLIRMECPNCKASLDINIEKLQAFCPYCGTKLLFDFEQINQILIEKEKTKRFQISQETEIQKIKIKQITEALETPGGAILAFLIGISIILIIAFIFD